MICIEEIKYQQFVDFNQNTAKALNLCTILK